MKPFTVKYDHRPKHEKPGMPESPGSSKTHIMQQRIVNLEHLLAQREQEITLLRQIIMNNPVKDHWGVPG